MNMELWDSTIIPSQYRLEDGQNVIATVLEVTLFCNFSVPYPVGGVSANVSLTNVNIYWTPPLRSNGVIIAYEVSYGPADSSDPETRLNTTDLPGD